MQSDKVVVGRDDMDRLIMMLTGKNIRETILFPLVRPGA